MAERDRLLTRRYFFGKGCAGLGVAAGEIGFVSSNYWDAAGAKNFGFSVFWINRAGAQSDALGAAPDAMLARLTELRAHLD